MFSLFLMTCRGTAYTQEPPEDMQQDTPEAEAAPQPEVPKQPSTVMIENNRLSVEFVNMNFGEILRAIGQKAGFQVEGSSPAFGKQVTTKFNDLDIDKGIIRLFSLVKESNYLISYDSKGAVSKLRVSSLGAPFSTPASPTRAPILRRRGMPIPQPQVLQPTPPQPEENTGNEDAPDE